MSAEDYSFDALSAAGYVQRARGTLIATVPHGDDGVAVDELLAEVLSRLEQGEARNVVIDASRIMLIDLHDFGRLRQLMAMAGAMGARCLLCGVQPSVASTLVMLEAEVDDIEAFSGLDAALDALQASPEPGAPHAQ